MFSDEDAQLAFDAHLVDFTDAHRFSRSDREHLTFTLRRPRQLTKRLRRNLRADIRLAYNLGYSTRAAAKFSGASIVTVLKWFSIWNSKSPRLCKCGAPATHQGWCRVRFSNSQRRQQFMKRWTDRQRDAKLNGSINGIDGQAR